MEFSILMVISPMFNFIIRFFSSSKVALLYDEGLAGAPLNNSGLIAWYLLSGNGNEQNGHNNLVINNIQFNGVSSASTSTNYWLKLGSIQPRESYIAFMGFALPNISLFNNTNDGESAQLYSPSYDDGPNVFDFYANFMGSSIVEPSQYSTTNSIITPSYTAGTSNSLGYMTTLSNQGSASSYLEWSNGPSSLKNGLIIEASSYYGAPESSKPADQQILGALASSDPQESVQGFISCGGSGQPADTGIAWSADPYCTSAFIEYDGSATTTSSYQLPNNNYLYYEFYILPNSQKLYLASSSEPFEFPQLTGLSDVFNAAYSISPSGGVTYVGDTSGGASHTARYYWIITRAYPPNGVMPTESVGPLNGQVN